MNSREIMAIFLKKYLPDVAVPLWEEQVTIIHPITRRPLHRVLICDQLAGDKASLENRVDVDRLLFSNSQIIYSLPVEMIADIWMNVMVMLGVNLNRKDYIGLYRYEVREVLTRDAIGFASLPPGYQQQEIESANEGYLKFKVEYRSYPI